MLIQDKEGVVYQEIICLERRNEKLAHKLSYILYILIQAQFRLLIPGSGLPWSVELCENLQMYHIFVVNRCAMCIYQLHVIQFTSVMKNKCVMLPVDIESILCYLISSQDDLSISGHLLIAGMYLQFCNLVLWNTVIEICFYQIQVIILQLLTAKCVIYCLFQAPIIIKQFLGNLMVEYQLQKLFSQSLFRYTDSTALFKKCHLHFIICSVR